jgi:hypothetical protein
MSPGEKNQVEFTEYIGVRDIKVVLQGGDIHPPGFELREGFVSVIFVK